MSGKQKVSGSEEDQTSFFFLEGLGRTNSGVAFLKRDIGIIFMFFFFKRSIDVAGFELRFLAMFPFLRA